MYQNFCTFAEAIIISLIYYILVFLCFETCIKCLSFTAGARGWGERGGGVIAKLGCHLEIKGISINYIAALAAFSLVQTIDVVCMHEVVTVKRDAAEIKFQCRMSLLKMLWRRKQKNEKESIMNWEGGGSLMSSIRTRKSIHYCHLQINYQFFGITVQGSVFPFTFKKTIIKSPKWKICTKCGSSSFNNPKVNFFQHTMILNLM